MLWRLLPEVVHTANTLGAHFSYLFNLKAAIGINFLVLSIYNLLNDCRRFLTSVADKDPYVLALPDPHPDPLVNSTYPAKDPSIIKQK